MTKQEKIQEAYGENWEEMKPFIDENGWFDKNSFYNNQFTFNYEQLDKAFSHKGDVMRPAELNGIENNKGWIIVEPPSELPIDKIECYFIDRYSEMHSGFYHPALQEFRSGNRCFEFYEITHYQPIQKPNPPLY